MFIINNYNYGPFLKSNDFETNILTITNLKGELDTSIIDYIDDNTFKIDTYNILETENELFNTYKNTLHTDITLLLNIKNLKTLKIITNDYLIYRN